MGPDDQRPTSADTLLSFFALQPAGPGLCNTLLWSACGCLKPISVAVSHQVTKAEQFRGAFSCARTVTAPCSLCLHLTALLPLFLHLLWSSLTPSRTPSRVKNQSTIFRRFHELGGSGEPGRCRSGGLDGNGKATREGAVSALGQPG